MSTDSTPFAMPRIVASKVGWLRRLVRMYVWLEGAAGVAVVLGIAFWCGLAVDWSLEPRPATRVVMWFVAGLAATVVAFRLLLTRAMAPLAADSLALLIERQHPELQEGLITTVQAAGRSVDGPCQRELIESTAQCAADAMPRVRLARVMSWRPLIWKTIAAVAVVGSIVLFGALAPEVYATWLRRMQFDPQPWPRRVQLSVAGFAQRDGERVEYVARDDEFELVVYASIVDDHEAPELVEVRWRRLSDGGRGGGPMRRIGAALPGRDEAQEYRFTFKASVDLEFEVSGGDDHVGQLMLRAVERPTVTNLSIDCVYPEYMRTSPRRIAAGDRVELPKGASAAILATANKPLTQVVVRDVDNDAAFDAVIDDGDPRTFTIDLGIVENDRRIAIGMVDYQSVENRQPYRLLVSAKPDAAPDVSARLRGIGLAITPQAVLPVDGRLTDDYGLQEAWLEYRVNDAPAQRLPMQTEVEGLREARVLEPLDLMAVDAEAQDGALEIQPGDRLSLSLRCSDAYNLSDSLHVGQGQSFLLDVVTPSELRAILEKRELGLRQRFEAIVEKMDATRELLDRIETTASGAETDDQETANDDGAADTLARRRQRDIARISGIRQTATQLAFESSGLADGFDDIVAEMVNNRVDTQELKQRLSEGISAPLRVVGGELIPQWEMTLGRVHVSMDHQSAELARELTAAKVQAEEIVEQMKAILQRMLELESYNEIVEALRSILEQQKELSEATTRQQRADLRSLLEE